MLYLCEAYTQKACVQGRRKLCMCRGGCV